MNYEKPAEIAEAVHGELTHFGAYFRPEGYTAAVRVNELSLLVEPFIGYAEVSAEEGMETYLFCRNFTPAEFKPATRGMEFACYLSPMGSIFAQRTGHKGKAGRRFVTLNAKAQFMPVRDGKVWDAKKSVSLGMLRK